MRLWVRAEYGLRYVICCPYTKLVACFVRGEQQYPSDLKIEKNPTVVLA